MRIFCMYDRYMPNKRGRRRKPRGQAKAEVMIVRLEPAEKAAFNAAAGFAGQDLSVWVRNHLRQASRKELEELGQPVPFLEQALNRNGREGTQQNGHRPNAGERRTISKPDSLAIQDTIGTAHPLTLGRSCWA